MLYILKTHAITTTTGFQLNRHRIEFTIELTGGRNEKKNTTHNQQPRSELSTFEC